MSGGYSHNSVYCNSIIPFNCLGFAYVLSHTFWYKQLVSYNGLYAGLTKGSAFIFYTTAILQNSGKFVHFQWFHSPRGWTVLRCRVQRVQMYLLFCAEIAACVMFAPPHNDVLVAYGIFNEHDQLRRCMRGCFQIVRRWVFNVGIIWLHGLLAQSCQVLCIRVFKFKRRFVCQFFDLEIAWWVLIFFINKCLAKILYSQWILHGYATEWTSSIILKKVILLGYLIT